VGGNTGRKAKWTVIIVGRFEGEKLAEDWIEYDRYNLFRQLGAPSKLCCVGLSTIRGEIQVSN
jgi:hypothetical protein